VSGREPRYLSYLLRLWPVRQNGIETWRASLEDPRTGERRGFAGLATLMNFLREQTEGKRDKDINDQIQEKN
jgi:hypothetical protein